MGRIAMPVNEVLEAIFSRRSVREFTSSQVSDELIAAILEAGRWAPSGLNNQPWRFIVVRDRATLNEMAKLTVYGKIIKNAPVAIAVFLDENSMYDRTKDILGIGACIQNMLLAAHSIGLGGVWLGEILKNKEKVNALLLAPESLELMAVLAIGYPVQRKRTSDRIALSKIAYREKYNNPFQ
jgi:nitroreductase